MLFRSEPTNLHFHGLHIPPTGEADNVFRHVKAGETALYRFTIPDPHPGGLAYYHPHLHGYVADQILGGLGGLFIVRGALDQIPAVQAAQEIFLFLKDFMGDRRPFRMGRIAGREGDLITINGKLSPNFEIAAGGLVRLRIVNASNAQFYRLSLDQHPFYLIATDGHALAAPIQQAELLLSPGERADVLVEATQTPGRYQLWQLPYERGGMGMMGGGMMGRGMMGGTSRSEPEAIATFTYQGETEPRSLPSKLADVEPLSPPKKIRQFSLNHGMVPGQGMVFLINGKAFAPQRVDTTVKLESIEDWEIVNTGVMDHPFHLHTNAFQVIERNGRVLDQPLWKDTVLVPRGERVKIRIPFRDYAGKTVYHCHILDHEELGMMGMIEMQAN